MIDEVDPAAPWEPEALRLVVGDRVRVRIRAECPLLARGGNPPQSSPWHPSADVDGIPGRVLNREEDPAYATHPYCVEYGPRRFVALFARAELERLPPSADPYGLEWRL